ncbi:unnamed protein product [Penicillium nalgiovense]|nr:unnamed protein product [Penicillium nalgiovense]
MAVDHDLPFFIFNHIFFPPKLPQQAEVNLTELEHRLTVLVRGVLQEFVQSLSPESQQRWGIVLSMWDTWNKVHTDQGIVQIGLEKALSNLKYTGAVACHIRAQNCGWVASYDVNKDRVLVDAFEVSCQGGPVLSSSGGLLRQFPGVSVSISADKLADPTFCSYLAAQISRLTCEEVSEMLPKSTKAGTKVDEIRDTTHPGLVTEGLMTQLLALGTLHEERKFVKCVREEVNWDCALLPWRRSPAWLVLRVALQLVLRRCFPEADSRLQYKNFILYLMATLAGNQSLSVGSHEVVDGCEIMRARLGRRLHKMKDEVFPFVGNRAHSTSKVLLDKLMSIQEQIKISNSVKIPLIPPSASEDDVHLSLVHCKDYLQAAMSSSPDEVQPTKFRPTHESNLNWSNGLPVPKFGSIIALSEFEQWVDEHLQSWFVNQPASKHESACCKIGSITAQYLSMAQPKYYSNPQATSVMILVVLELWVVLDKMALQLCPLLGKFSPGIPESFLEPLLLPKIGQMERARQVEHHIDVRHKEALKANPSIFCDPTKNCFGVQYFDCSDEHQALERKIQQHATQTRASKRVEWEMLCAKHKRMCQTAEKLSHYYGYNRYDQYVHFTHRCEKCGLQTEAASISIQVHEWPLPTELNERKTAVFELNIPIWFASWRNTTWEILHAVGRRGTVVADNNEVEWLQYKGIEDFAVRRDSNIILVSCTKSWGKTHYRKHKFPVPFDDICIPNGLGLKLFDKVSYGWVREQTEKPTIKLMCTIQLPSGPYSNLQYTLSSTSHTQNQVIVTQNDCDKTLSLHEFEAFGCLPSSALSLNEEAVASLFKQAAWELGTRSGSGSVRRVAHRAFEDIDFGDCLLDLLQGRLITIKKNWNEHCTFDLIVTLALRVLTLSSGSPSVEKVIEFLRQCRQVAINWCDELNGVSDDEGNDGGSQQQLTLRIASTCQATYDVDPIHLDTATKTPQDVFCFVRSSILLFENSPPKTDSPPPGTELFSENTDPSPEIRYFLVNAERIRSLLRSRIRCIIMECPSGLNEAIQSSITCLEVSGPWEICTESEIWRVLPVVPSSLPGASFVLSRNIEDLEVHFGMQRGRILIQTRKGSQILQLIPPDVLVKDFPRVFISDNFHWLDPQTGVVEFRPLSHPWKACPRNWRLSFDPYASSIMQQDSKILVDIRSTPFRNLCHILEVLDAGDEIVITQTAAGTLEAELSRLRLKFFINADGRLASKEFGALVDIDQDVGCFYGLKNKLVLVDSSNNRSIIVPYGHPVVNRKDDHVAVTIDLPTGNRVTYMHYCLDSTEEAIRILRQGSLRSSFPLQSYCIETLEWIAALTPHRYFYPRHLRVMQTVTWSSNLNQLAQHDDFQPLAQDILQAYIQCAHFHDTKPRGNEISYRGSMGLLQRSRCRNEQLRSSEFGGPPTSFTKKVYKSRDCDTTSARSSAVYSITGLIRDWPSTVGHSSSIVATMRQCKEISMLSDDFTRYSYSEVLSQSAASSWVALYKACQASSRARDTYSLISLFSTLAFGGKIDRSILRQLLQVAFSEKCKNITVPRDSKTSLNLTLGEDFAHSQVEDAIRESYEPFAEIRDPYLKHEEEVESNRRAKLKWKDQREKDVQLCGEHIRRQWPCKAPQLLSSNMIPLVSKSEAYERCKILCGNWIQNRNFLRFLRQVQSQVPLSKSSNSNVEPVPTSHMHSQEIEYTSFQPPRLLDLIQMSRAGTSQTEVCPVTYHAASSILRPTPELWALATHFQGSSNQCQQDYGNGLSHSVQALEDFSSSVPTTGNFDLSGSADWAAKRATLLSHQKQVQRASDLLWEEIVITLTIENPSRPSTDIVYPSITVWSVLSILAHDQWANTPAQWRALLVAFGKTISALRRCQRLISYIEKRDMDGFLKDAENPGYEGWDPLIYPTWLLLEIENNITIRKRQVEVALRMIEPDDGENAVLQLNMGEGKTSVITPMVATVLANGHNLLRIVVLKPLLRQSDGLLSQRLGGLIQRRIYHIPFSRHTQLTSSTVGQLKSIYRQCRRDRGILIALPEQILSFRLIGLDAAERNPDIFASLIALEHWLQRHCRDVIDESDEVMDTKFQLVYTMGTQQSLDGLSGRWEITQQLLRLVSTQAKSLQQDDPGCVEVDQSGYRYPILRFLKPYAVELLVSYTLTSILENGIPGLPFAQWPPKVKGSALRFIQQSDLTEEDQAIIQQEFNGSIFITKLLALRGLFAHRILRFSLADKRWLVEYGLHPSRRLMAVPYRAKGVPSESAEFGHPDVAVTLTCLSYYYEGLTKAQLRDCFILLAKQNDPSTEFQNWVAPCLHDLPVGLQAYSGVNLEDDKTFSEILFPLLRYQKEILDFYLSHFVFSREAKEFPRKLSSSAWDIPARRGLQLTTGFSGTNDNRFLLPLSVRQRDLGELLHTNAMVLGLLLREENRKCILAQDEKGRQLDVEGLLKLVVSTDGGSTTLQPVRVLIDVGAQILEAGNQSVAQQWLAMTPEADVEAAIFFNHSDEIMVIDREGHVENLLSSSFRQRMGACLVFLDQQHSRGVDLKLPPMARAAVTLGPRLTKDRLVQACNRLRGLEKCQSLFF